jgi:DNA-binding XRE family transcriptional regulator
MEKAHWNQKVSANRGLAWRKKLLAGRLDIQMNPTHLRLRRIKKNKTQMELAALSGMSNTTYGAVESGRRPVVKEKGEKIAKALGIGFDDAFSQSKTHKKRFVAIRNK